VCMVITHFLNIILIKCVCESNQDEIRSNAFNTVYGNQAVKLCASTAAEVLNVVRILFSRAFTKHLRKRLLA